jgi:hypothetical protein
MSYSKRSPPHEMGVKKNFDSEITAQLQMFHNPGLEPKVIITEKVG